VAATLGVKENAIYGALFPFRPPFTAHSPCAAVNDFQASAAGTTLIYFDIELPATTSSAIPAMFGQVANLFEACLGAGVSPVGCPAGPTSSLVTHLQQFGLPITDAYYNQQPAAASPGGRKASRRMLL